MTGVILLILLCTVRYTYSFDIHTSRSCRFIMGFIDGPVLRQMSDILATSFVILLILVFSFRFLIRAILKQKTLKEMNSDFEGNPYFCSS